MLYENGPARPERHLRDRCGKAGALRLFWIRGALNREQRACRRAPRRAALTKNTAADYDRFPQPRANKMIRA
ncbi:hypothetical protein EVAR_97178_1 [Eumeta japonica]|uniref:Uncharacterized protein n=1 Tax=Eumeta variegata TaxID=151549 RepID=A0A4C1TMT4_EUMVA|nr:hypothetical protein EVAR_97178_1 [Eumeta japonica]